MTEETIKAVLSGESVLALPGVWLCPGRWIRRVPGGEWPSDPQDYAEAFTDFAPGDGREWLRVGG